MSYSQKFKGCFTFADLHCLEAGLDAFVEDLDDVLFSVHDLMIDHNSVCVDFDGSAPASMYEATQIALDRLSNFADGGGIKTEFHLDGVSRDVIGYGGLESSEGLPPRHRKWEVYVAAKHGDDTALAELRDAGIDITQNDALLLASIAGDPASVRMVLAAGAKPDANTLAAAANEETAEVLLEAGAPVDGVTSSTRSVFALVCEQSDVAALLFERGAKIVASDYASIASTLARAGNVDLLRQVVERAPEITQAFTISIRDAIRSNEPVMLDFLIDHGAKLPDDLLYQAIVAGAVAIVENIVRTPDGRASCGASTEREDAMCVAAASGAIAVIEMLAKHGVPIQPAIPASTSPLIEAASAYDRRAIKAVTWLLDHGVPVTSVDARGQSVLQRASFAEVQALLVKRGADRGQIVWDDMAAEDQETLHRLLGD
ncbi:MAG: hypothetical protein QM831_27050 [Kofleriaceae bacterium]